MNTRQLLSVGIDIGTTTTQVIFSHLELVNRAAVSQVPRYEFIKREISWQSPVFFTPVDKQGGLKEAELKTLMNRPGFPGECFICELRLPDHRFRWKHNKLFLLLPEEYGPAFPAIVDCYTSPPT